MLYTSGNRALLEGFLSRRDTGAGGCLREALNALTRNLGETTSPCCDSTPLFPNRNGMCALSSYMQAIHKKNLPMPSSKLITKTKKTLLLKNFKVNWKEKEETKIVNIFCFYYLAGSTCKYTSI